MTTEERIERLEAEIESLRGRLNQAITRVDVMTSENDGLKVRLETFAAGNVELQARIGDLERRLQSLAQAPKRPLAYK